MGGASLDIKVGNVIALPGGEQQRLPQWLKPFILRARQDLEGAIAHVGRVISDLCKGN